jgi:2-oxoacid:acceptor oxidoreductase delta subunit (pyruvate/2-ketoisovalerate family)
MTAENDAKAGKPAAKRKPNVKQPVLKKQQWDVSDIQKWGVGRHELGATIPEAGNSIYNVTGGWRTFVPEIDSEKCDGCMLCYFYCPDASILIENDKAVGVDLAHCKGCGICAKECPTSAIVMHLEEKE